MTKRAAGLLAMRRGWEFRGTGVSARLLALGLVRSAVIGAVALGAAPSAFAQSETRAPSETRSFAIPAGPLGPALVQYGRQAGLQVTYLAAAAAGKTTAGFSGVATRQQAIARILAGSGLAYSFPNAATVAITAPADPASGPAQAGGAILLDTLQVDGDGTVGFVATRTEAGTKTNTPLIEVPQSISVVTREELDVRAVQTDPEALTYTPGIYAQPFGGAQNQQNPYYIIRGFPSAQGGSYVDGLISYINYRYEPFGYSRYDVVRGPSSTLYGQSDPGGLVNRDSKLPTAQPFGEIQLQAGNFQRYQGAFDFGGPADEAGKVLYRITGLFRDANAPIYYDYGITAPDERQFIAPALTLKVTEDTTITVLANYLKDKIGQENSFLWPATRQLTHLALPPINGSDGNIWNQEQWAIGYLLEHRFSNDLVFRQKARYSHMSTTIVGSWAWDVVGSEAFLALSGNDEWRNDFVLDNNIEYRFQTAGLQHTLVAGLDYQNNADWIAFTDNWNIPPFNIAFPNYNTVYPAVTPWQSVLYKQQVLGFYAQDQIKYNNWILTLGARQDFVWGSGEGFDLYAADPIINEVSDDSKLTYRAGLTHVFDSGVAPYVSYSTSFLPQSGVDAFGNVMKPTTGEQWEAGVKYQPPGWNLMLTAAVFDLKKQNVPTPYGPDPYGPQVQDGEITSRGIELQATASIEGWNLNASYTYNDVVVTEANPDVPNSALALGKHPRWVPDQLASVWVDYTFSSGHLAGFNLGGGVRYVGTSYADALNTIANDPYTLVDAVMRYDLGRLSPQMKGAQLALNATNLLGTQYSTCFSAFDCKWGAQRTVIGTLTYKW